MKRLIIFWGIENDYEDAVNVKLERDGDDHYVFAYGDQVEINFYIGDDPERNDLTYDEAIRRRIRQLNRDVADSEESDDSDDNRTDT